MKDRRQIFKFRIRRGDMVTVISGRHKGQQGRVLEVHPRLNKITVENLNVVKRHLKPSKTHPQGGVIDVTKPIWASKVALIDPVKNQPTRVGFKLDKDGNKARIYKKSKKEVVKSVVK